jgi:RNA polymerase sigma-70 factor (ECF subfamily)
MAETFEAYRPYLFAIAYRMLGSAMDAEDMVQETFLRAEAANAAVIVSPKAYLATILTRLCVNELHSAHTRREQYVGPWLPEPIATEGMAEAADPEERVEAEETISLAFLTLLEELQPVERAVFLLREVFDYEYGEIAGMLGKSEAACRQAFSRAKKHLAEHRPRYAASPESHRRMLTTFLQAVRGGDMAALTTLLADDVMLWADGGGKVRGAVTRPIHGRDAVARFAVGSLRLVPAGYAVEIAEINGLPSAVVRAGGRVFSVLSIEVDGERIGAVRVVANPEKLARLSTGTPTP